MATSLSPNELDLASLNLTNQPPEMKFVDNNGSVHKDLLVHNFKFHFVKKNKKGSVYYKCRFKDGHRKECGASLTTLKH